MIAARDNLRTARAIVALGGGGARGLAHFGAMQSIFETGISVDRIVGTSIGALAGAVCATHQDFHQAVNQVIQYVTSEEFQNQQASLCGTHPKPNTMQTSGMLAWYDRIKSYLFARRLLTRIFRRQSLLSGHVIREVIEALIPDIDIADTRIPLSIVAVDLKSGHQVILEHGSLRRAILASAAIPGIFPPIEWDDMLLCDLGVLESLPTEVAHSYGGETVIAVDVGPDMEHVQECESALHVLLRMDEIGERRYRRHSQRLADILICPDVGQFEWFEFSKPDALIRAGLQAGRAAMLQKKRTAEPVRSWARKSSESNRSGAAQVAHRST